MTEQQIIVGGELRSPEGQETSAAMKLLVLLMLLTVLRLIVLLPSKSNSNFSLNNVLSIKGQSFKLQWFVVALRTFFFFFKLSAY